MRNVAIGPKKRDTIHQFKPLLPFVCARPAFMRERVDQPTAYSPVSRIIIRLLEASGRQPESLAIRNGAYSKVPVLITPGIQQKGKFRKRRACSSSQKAPKSLHARRLHGATTQLFAREGPMMSSERRVRDSGRGGACRPQGSRNQRRRLPERLQRSPHAGF